MLNKLSIINAAPQEHRAWKGEHAATSSSFHNGSRAKQQQLLGSLRKAGRENRRGSTSQEKLFKLINISTDVEVAWQAKFCSLDL